MKRDRGALRGPPLCPPLFLLRGYPSSAELVLGRPASTMTYRENSPEGVRNERVRRSRRRRGGAVR